MAGNDKRESSETGQPSRGAVKTLTTTGPEHRYRAAPINHPHLARGQVPHRWKDAIITVLRKKIDKTECGNYRGISLVPYAGQVLLEVAIKRLGDSFGAKGLLPEEQRGFRPDRSTTYTTFVVHGLQEIGRKAGVSLFIDFDLID